ncbi:MAG TPA: three-Cys-motif partner protein TcmP [Pirellulales bacterium]
MAKAFFNEATEQSVVKATIVEKYFMAWFTAIKKTVKAHDNRVAYLDLFAGPGRYEDGTTSTPLLVLKQAIADPDLRQMLVTRFNDKDDANCKSLDKAIGKLKGIETLKYKPYISHGEVGTEMVKEFESVNLIPTLFFGDPWGYKGLSLKLINSVLKDFMCECIFFFNYNRINMGLPNSAVDHHIDALFGKDRADVLREKLIALKPAQRELAILEGVCESLIDMGGKYVLPFRFKRPDGSRTSHHLIFVSKHPLGYKIMKGVMAKESSWHDQGVPSFEYNPSYRDEGLLFEFARPLDELEGLLLEEFAGKTLTMGAIFEKHNYGRRFIEPNYKECLRKMEEKKLITCDPPANDRVKRLGVVTFADHVEVTFPKAKKKG